MNTIKFQSVYCYESDDERLNDIIFIFNINDKKYHKKITINKGNDDIEYINFDPFVLNIYISLNIDELKLFIENFNDIYSDFCNFIMNHVKEKISKLNEILNSYTNEDISENLKYLKTKDTSNAIKVLTSSINYIEKLVTSVYLKTSKEYEFHNKRLIELQEKKKILENQLIYPFH